jgi:hypothetical protein
MPRPTPDDLLTAIQVSNAGPVADTLHVLLTAWLRTRPAGGEVVGKPAREPPGRRWLWQRRRALRRLGLGLFAGRLARPCLRYDSAGC